MIKINPDLVNDLQAEVGDSLRSVALYDSDGYEFEFLRDDIEATYTESEIEEVYEDLVLQGMSRDFLEQLFHAGHLQCGIYGFEEAAMFHFIANEFAGLFVSIDSDVELNLETIISLCKGAIESPE